MVAVSPLKMNSYHRLVQGVRSGFSFLIWTVNHPVISTKWKGRVWNMFSGRVWVGLCVYFLCSILFLVGSHSCDYVSAITCLLPFLARLSLLPCVWALDHFSCCLRWFCLIPVCLFAWFSDCLVLPSDCILPAPSVLFACLLPSCLWPCLHAGLKHLFYELSTLPPCFLALLSNYQLCQSNGLKTLPVSKQRIAMKELDILVSLSQFANVRHQCDIYIVNTSIEMLYLLYGSV